MRSGFFSVGLLWLVCCGSVSLVGDAKIEDSTGGLSGTGASTGEEPPEPILEPTADPAVGPAVEVPRTSGLETRGTLLVSAVA